MDIDEFITARLDEMKAAAEADLDEAALAIYNSATAHPRRKPCESFITLPPPVQERYRTLAFESRPVPARVLRKVAADRAILAEHPQVKAGRRGFGDPDTGCRTCHADTHCGEIEAQGLCETIRYLAAPDDNHPDYNPAWRLT